MTIEGTWSIQPDETSRYVVVETSKMWRDQSENPTIPAIDAVRSILLDTSFISQNQTYQSDINGIKNDLSGYGLNITYTKVPVIFLNGYAYTPNMVNSFVSGGSFDMPKPYGPQDNGSDVLESDVSGSPVEDWHHYHTMEGEVHCGTNAKRSISITNWWE